MTFSVLASRAIPGAMLEVSLLDPAGRPCGLAYTNPQDLPAATPVTFTNPSGLFLFSDTFANVGCTLPASIAIVKVILLTLTGPPDSFLTRTEYHAQTFALAYSLREYPQAPPEPPPTPPAIASFTWKNGTPACGIPCAPVPGDPVSVTCVATAADGAEATMLLTIIWDNGTMTSSSRSFPAGATSAPGGASFFLGSTAVGQSPRATAECRVTNVRRETASSTIRIPG
jgi:hypothetical protein